MPDARLALMLSAHRRAVCVPLGAALALSAFAACESSVNLGDPADAAAADAVSEVDAPDAPVEGAADTGSSSDATEAGQTFDAADAGTDAPDAGPKHVFVTRATYAGNFGGLDGGDFRCQSSAAAAGFGGTFKAWLSDSQNDAANRIISNGPWVEVGSAKLLFADRAALRGYPQAPLTSDELGQTAPDRWWTGTLANGVRAGDTCTNWSTADQFIAGMTGTRVGTGVPSKEWTEDVAYACVGLFALVCFED